MYSRIGKNVNYGYKNASFKPFSVCDENGSLPEMYIGSAEVQNGFWNVAKNEFSLLDYSVKDTTSNLWK